MLYSWSLSPWFDSLLGILWVNLKTSLKVLICFTKLFLLNSHIIMVTNQLKDACKDFCRPPDTSMWCEAPCYAQGESTESGWIRISSLRINWRPFYIDSHGGKYRALYAKHTIRDIPYMDTIRYVHFLNSMVNQEYHLSMGYLSD